MAYIDLTMALTPDTPVYPGDPQVEITQITSVADDGYMDHTVKMGTHNGTHIDAPAHMIEGGKMLSDFPLDTFIGPGKLVDARNGLTPAGIDAAGVEQGDIVLLYTGASDIYTDPDYYYHEPVVSDEAAMHLIKLGVKMVGLDMGSIDEDPFIIHKALLRKDILIIENLVNLSALLNAEFKIHALPLNLHVEGAPARVIAETR
jgi:kynurenine formamidase